MPITFETSINRKGKKNSYSTTVPLILMKTFNYPRKIRWRYYPAENKVCVEFVVSFEGGED